MKNIKYEKFDGRESKLELWWHDPVRGLIGWLRQLGLHSEASRFAFYFDGHLDLTVDWHGCFTNYPPPELGTPESSNVPDPSYNGFHGLRIDPMSL